MQTINPEHVGFSPRRLHRLDAVMRRYVDEGKLAGVITLLARRGEVAHCECFGRADIEDQTPMQLDALFRIFSMTKPITSVALLMLYEEGHFQLSDPVSRFIPEFKETQVLAEVKEDEWRTTDLEREITIHDLFTHTAGLAYGLDRASPVDVRYQDEGVLRMDEPLSDKIKRIAALPLAHQPGQAWKYSVATDVLGYLVEIIAGAPFDAFLKERIFAPLGMTDTDFYVPADKQRRLTTVYEPDPGDKSKENASIRALGAMDAPKEEREATEAWINKQRKPAFLSGGGGLISTIGDYLRFALMLRNQGSLEGERLLGRQTVELMTQNHLPPHIHTWDDPAWGFGLGVGVLLDPARAKILGSAGAYGWGGAASTDYWHDPQEDLIGILMTQFMPSGHYPIAQEFKVLAQQAIVD